MAHSTPPHSPQPFTPSDQHTTPCGTVTQNALSNPPHPLCLHTAPTLSISSPTFTVTAQYSLPTGGIFSLHISASNHPPYDSPTVYAEHVSHMPDGFLTDLNPKLLILPERYPPQLARDALDHAVQLLLRFRYPTVVTEEDDENATDEAADVADAVDADAVDAERAERGLSVERVRLLREARQLSDGETRCEGFVCWPKEGDQLRWEVWLYFDDAVDCSLQRELSALGRESVEIELVFEGQSVECAPLIRVVAPYLVGGEVVGGGGGVFVEEFSRVGWTPVYTVRKICGMVRMLIAGSGVRVDEECVWGVVNYSEEGAREDVSFMEERFVTTLKMGENSGRQGERAEVNGQQ